MSDESPPKYKVEIVGGTFMLCAFLCGIFWELDAIREWLKMIALHAR
jgi:hypothetical protein